MNLCKKCKPKVREAVGGLKEFCEREKLSVFRGCAYKSSYEVGCEVKFIEVFEREIDKKLG